MSSGFPELSGVDIASGYPYGPSPPVVPTGAAANRGSLVAWHDALRPALLRSPCVVAFSGGRDSSLLLASLAALAKREGHRPPTALSLRYPGDPAAEESGWQRLVVDHLRGQGLPVRWQCVDIVDELDIVGPLTAPLLRRHGSPLWPPAIGATVFLCRRAAGGALVTGNFGDEVLGGHRAAVLRTVVGLRGRGLSRADRRHAVRAVAPRLVARISAGTDPADRSWLRPPFRAEVLRRAARSTVRPLRWDRSVRTALATRAVQIGQTTRHRVADGYGCALVEPLGEPRFVAALAAHGGPLAAPGRGAVTSLLAEGRLPDPVLGRRTKARFNGSRFGPRCRAFLRTWDGRGIDDELVDADALRLAWSSPVVPAATGMLLQQAWLAAHGGSG